MIPNDGFKSAKLQKVTQRQPLLEMYSFFDINCYILFGIVLLTCYWENWIGHISVSNNVSLVLLSFSVVVWLGSTPTNVFETVDV